MASQKNIFRAEENFYLVKITKYTFSACLKKFFETPHEMVLEVKLCIKMQNFLAFRNLKCIHKQLI